jgi:alkyldihydroxyacetonephosphate synthase
VTVAPGTGLADVQAALAGVLGADAVTADPARLDAYTADTYWPALAAQAPGRSSS